MDAGKVSAEKKGKFQGMRKKIESFNLDCVYDYIHALLYCLIANLKFMLHVVTNIMSPLIFYGPFIFHLT